MSLAYTKCNCTSGLRLVAARYTLAYNKSLFDAVIFLIRYGSLKSGTAKSIGCISFTLSYYVWYKCLLIFRSGTYKDCDSIALFCRRAYGRNRIYIALSLVAFLISGTLLVSSPLLTVIITSSSFLISDPSAGFTSITVSFSNSLELSDSNL